MTQSHRIALISDIHGNVSALTAVLADIDARGIETIYNLGDVAGKGPRGSAAVRLSQQRCAVTIGGNWDDFLPDVQPTDSEPLRWWREELSPADRQWLRDLPLVYDLMLSGRRIRLFHASAQSVYTRVWSQHTPEEFDGMFAATELTGPGPAPDLVAYGDIHETFLKVADSRTLLNVGSVGNPLDEPTAAYAILEGTPGEGRAALGIQCVRVPYDVEAEIAVATSLDMPTTATYAIELRTAVYRGLHAARGLG